MGVLKTGLGFISGDYREKAEIVWNLIQGWKFFYENEVVVGIPEEENVARENGMTNAGLLYLHEQGVPSHNIPPRPVLKPAIAREDVKGKIETLMRDAAESALVDGNVDNAKVCFEKAGMVGRDACKKYITEGTHLTPNAPSTIERKMEKGNNKKGAPVPLVDTASMLNSITYAVRRKK